ncbi:MAG: hypothetical protein QXI39_01950 [Candidatus Bathyarchaeia archaeon]
MEGNYAIPSDQGHPLHHELSRASEHQEYFNLRTARREEALFKNSDEGFICKTTSSVEEAKPLIEAGFDYVCDIDGIKLFRKRK